jgi:hypothetical protein
MTRALPMLAALVLVVVPGPAAFGADLKPGTLAAWDQYIKRVEARIDGELAGSNGFLVESRVPANERTPISSALKTGRVFSMRLRGPELRGGAPDVPDGLIHHWLGLVFVPGATVDQVIAFVQRYNDHAQFFSDVIESRLLSRDGDRFDIFLKLRRKKVVTVTYDTTHTVVYRRHDAQRSSSRSVSTKIAQLEDAGLPGERERPVGHDSGYMWRLNSYWRFEQREGGVVVECESVSLSRDIPFGLHWLIGSMVENISRESLENTLGSIRRAVMSTVRAPGTR